METGGKLISVQDLVKEYNNGKVKALNHCNLDISRGEVVAIIGPSGSGKSTLLRSLNLLETPTAGRILFDGVNLADKSVNINLHRQRMGMVFQHFNLFPHKTVLENITMAPIQLKLKTRAEAEQTAMELLERIGLPDKAKEYPAMLSGGQKQRIAIAGMLAMQPEVLVLDEATAMLDPQGRQEVLSIVDRLHRERGITVVMITQYMEEVVGCDRVVVMDGGRIALTGTPRELFSRPDELRACGLDTPDAVQMRDKLLKSGVPLSGDPISIEELADSIWQSLSNR